MQRKTWQKKKHGLDDVCVVNVAPVICEFWTPTKMPHTTWLPEELMKVLGSLLVETLQLTFLCCWAGGHNRLRQNPVSEWILMMRSLNWISAKSRMRDLAEI